MQINRKDVRGTKAGMSSHDGRMIRVGRQREEREKYTSRHTGKISEKKTWWEVKQDGRQAVGWHVVSQICKESKIAHREKEASTKPDRRRGEQTDTTPAHTNRHQVSRQQERQTLRQISKQIVYETEKVESQRGQQAKWLGSRQASKQAG